MAQLPDDLRRLIGKKTDEVAAVIDSLVGQLDLSPEEEGFAREQGIRVFDLLSNAYIDAYPRVGRARAATAASVLTFAMIKVWAEHDEETDGAGPTS